MTLITRGDFVIVEDMTGMSVMGLQEMLRTISFWLEDIPGVIPDGIFGPETKDSVTAFQIVYGLKPTGEVDSQTWQRIREVYFQFNEIYGLPDECVFVVSEVDIKEGDESPELFVIQGMIKAISTELANVPLVDVNGVHDEKSVAAVIFIQNITGIEPTGNIDTRTYKNIANLYSSNVAKRINLD